MAQRGKRISRNDNDLASCPGAIKRRKCRLGPAAATSSLAPATGPSEEEETMASSSQGGASWTPRPLSDIKISSIYNRSSAEAPAELFRKDLISAMKLPDSEPLSPNEYWVITDQWKQEWERGVQVPVNPDSLPEPAVTVTQTSPVKQHAEFKLPKKFVRISRDDYFNPEDHHLSTTPARAEKACAYDLDDTDIAWLDVLNGERAQAGQPPVTESQLERVIEELEVRCWERIQTIVKNEEGLGIEYDENVICDVCRSPDSEEGNEMVFCDCCNICVHQACYGITSIPDGSWLCRTCSLSQRPDCVLCPNKGGAMKCTRSGQKWAHVSCALWIPEVSIGCVERMEPITKISSIPQSRWALICVLCRERVGACIQCSIKTCKTAYHVTCAFKHGLEMKAIIEDEMADDGVKLRSYCQKHSRTNTKDKVGVGGSIGSGGDKAASDSEDGESRRRKRKDMTSEEKNQARAAKLQEIEAEFDKHVSLKDIASQQLDVDPEGIVYIYNYWKLKRRAGHNKPLLAPRCGELSGAGARAQGQAADLEKMRTFVQLRQDLERVRNLCYMVGRREKLCRSFLRLREQTFHKQALVMSGPPLPPSAAAAVMEANHGPSIYDRLYSHPDSEDHTHDFDTIVARIAGVESPAPLSSDEKKPQPDFNGASSKKLYFNGSVRRKNLYASDLSSVSSSETDVKPQLPPLTAQTQGAAAQKGQTEKCAPKKQVKTESPSTSEEEGAKKPARRKSKKTPLAGPEKLRSALRETAEGEKLANSRSHTLQHMEKELGSASGSESDELLPLSAGAASKHLGPSVASAIYSDTDSDSQEHASHSAVLITKAAVKEFGAANVSKNSKSFCKEAANKENVKGNKKKEYIPSALIVPQRQAAKKASENMQRTQAKKEAEGDFQKSPVEEGQRCVKQRDRNSGAARRREARQAKEGRNNDVYDFDKEFGDGSEILAYVPQRQAAKKAAEHIKSGLGSKSASAEAEGPAERLKKESPEAGRRKEARREEARKEEARREDCRKEEGAQRKEDSPGKEERARRARRQERKSALSSNSESSSSSSCSSSTDSSSDSEAETPERGASNEAKGAGSSSTTSSESDAGPQGVRRSAGRQRESARASEGEKSPRRGRRPAERKAKPGEERTEGAEAQNTLADCAPPLRKTEGGRRVSTSLEETEQETQGPAREEKAAQAAAKEEKAAQGARGTKKGQVAKAQARGREEAGGREAKRPEARKRKSNEAAREEKAQKDQRKPERKATERREDKEEKEEKEEVKEVKEPPEEPAEKEEDRRRRGACKDAANTLEEEMKQRRAERDSPKKSLRGLDKLLEKREHLDKLSRSKNPEIKVEKPAEEEEKETEELRRESVKPEEKKNHVSEETSLSGLAKQEEETKREAESAPEEPVATLAAEAPQEEEERKTERSALPCKARREEEELATEAQAVAEEQVAAPEEPARRTEDQQEQKEPAERGVAQDLAEKEYHKRRKSGSRSIFSPQHAGKDPSVSELFDFDQDMLTDEMVNDDGFSIPRDAEERSAPLSFSFTNDLWFKEDSKEDSARETLHLVEKLRMELSKKSNSSQLELEGSAEEAKREEVPVERPRDPELDTSAPVEAQSVQEVPAEAPEEICRPSVPEEKRKPPAYAAGEERYARYGSEDRETGKVSLVERDKLDRAETDERWVPPSVNSFEPEVHGLGVLMDNQNHRYANHQFPNDVLAEPEDQETDQVARGHLTPGAQEQYLLQQTHSILRGAQGHLEPHTDARTQPLAILEQPVLPAQMTEEANPMEMVNRHLIGLPTSEDEQGSELMDRALEKEELPDVRQDYAQGSPYNEANGARQDTRWAESQVLPSRRSTSSSITSASSEDHSAIPPYKSVPAIPFPPCNLDAAPYHAYTESSSYAAPVSLFPPQSCTAPLPYPSPGTAMFPPPFGAPFPTPQSLLPHAPKPLEDSLNLQASPCTAAFTSSQHNMALTAAMVSPSKTATPPPQLAPVGHQEADRVPAQLQNQAASPSLPLAFLNAMPDSSQAAEGQNEGQADAKGHPSGKKSPSKPTRTSARVTSLQGKSPGKSPRQEVPKGVPSARRGRGAKSAQHASYRSRGRGRGRGRGRSGQGAGATPATGGAQGHHDDSIQNKLVGTVYDFDSDEDSTSEANIADLRTMRERKKSTDVGERREASSEGRLESPGVHRKYAEDRRPSPSQDACARADGEAGQTFADTVLPLLPGPVDMRTYNSTLDAGSSALHSQPYGNDLLGSFSGVASDPAIPDMEEDLEKELRSALGKQASEACGKPFDTVLDPASACAGAENKVSLTDSRNQLKVKIKGPFLDANYVPASSVPPLAQQAPVIIAPAATSASVASGTSNLRRMRKKELLRQYCSQDMNMDDPGCANATSAPIVIPPISRTVITIPKAVASMTSIPTREDYKAVVDANMEKKRRKERSGFLDPAEEDGGSDRRRGSGGAALSNADRRRGRQARPSASVGNNGPPKLKIKIGNSVVSQEPQPQAPQSQSIGAQDDRSRIRPPKKRLSSIPSTPSIEELRRESMKFRRMIMAGFDNDEKLRVKSKKDKNGKRKKRQSSRKEARVRILEGGAAPPKLIIRLGKNNNSSDGSDSNAQAALTEEEEAPGDSRVGPPPPEPRKEEPGYPTEGAPGEKQPTETETGSGAPRNVRSAKVTPIRLKLTRCQEGYELKGRTGEERLPEGGNGGGGGEREREREREGETEGPGRTKGQEEGAQTVEEVRGPSGCPAQPAIPQECQVR